MFIRITRVRRGDKVYEYPQLVEIYRKPGGRPAHRVLANLKDLNPQQLANLKLALAAGKGGSALVLAEVAQAPKSTRHTVSANRAYLDLAVFDATWDQWGLSALINEAASALPDAHQTDEPLSAVAEALVLQRCVAAASKLAATRWLPRTALPDLLSMKPKAFNNSRIHRDLDRLQRIEPQLQEQIARRVMATPGGVRALFLDLTDTWFVGKGPSLASRGKTKEGLNRQKVGIALLCDQRGFPVRWRMVRGSAYEASVMTELLKEAQEADLLGSLPVVMDRAMGQGVSIEALGDAAIRFVTALRRNEFESFTDAVPWQAFANFEPAGSKGTREQDLKRLGKLAVEAGMKADREDRFVLDLGVVRHERPHPSPADPSEGPIARLLVEVTRMRRLLDNDVVSTRKELGEWYGCDRATIHKYLQLDRLASAVKLRVAAGEAELLMIQELRAVARLPAERQLGAFEAQRAKVVDRGPKGSRPPKILDILRSTLWVRLVAVFNPQARWERTVGVRRKEAELRAFIEALNEKQALTQRPRAATSLLAEVQVLLQKHHWVDLFDVTTRRRRNPSGGKYHQIKLVRDDNAWARRHRYAGFQIIAAHPEIIATGPALVARYFSKDIVEKGFQTIKSVLQLRPVRHRTDEKVQAHVTLCVLALLLQRTIEETLRRAGVPRTAAATTELLAPCHLNVLKPQKGDPYYTLTEPTTEQRQLLDTLGMQHLIDEASIMDRLSL